MVSGVFFWVEPRRKESPLIMGCFRGSTSTPIFEGVPGQQSAPGQICATSLKAQARFALGRYKSMCNSHSGRCKFGKVQKLVLGIWPFRNYNLSCVGKVLLRIFHKEQWWIFESFYSQTNILNLAGSDFAPLGEPKSPRCDFFNLVQFFWLVCCLGGVGHDWPEYGWRTKMDLLRQNGPFRSILVSRILKSGSEWGHFDQNGRLDHFSEDHKPPMKPNPTWNNIVVASGRDIPGSQSRQLLQLKITPKMTSFYVGYVSCRLTLWEEIVDPI